MSSSVRYIAGDIGGTNSRLQVIEIQGKININYTVCLCYKKL